MIREISTAYHFPSKLLLFGEHTVVFGSRALAVPYPNYFGKWSICNENSISEKKILNDFIDYLIDNCNQFLSIERLLVIQKSVLFFESNIPCGCGLGSSGALCAAIYDYCSTEKTDLIVTKNQLARMENYFHGNSSGLDPLVSFTNSPLLINKQKDIIKCSLPINIDNFFLWDSNIERKAAEQIGIFAQKMKLEDFKQMVYNDLIPLSNNCINAVLGKNTKALIESFEKLSRFQLENLDFLIPKTVQEYWRKGLESKEYFMKLCGAGGGGYFLGLKNKPL